MPIQVRRRPESRQEHNWSTRRRRFFQPWVCTLNNYMASAVGYFRGFWSLACMIHAWVGRFLYLPRKKHTREPDALSVFSRLAWGILCYLNFFCSDKNTAADAQGLRYPVLSVCVELNYPLNLSKYPSNIWRLFKPWSILFRNFLCSTSAMSKPGNP